ncbi:MAG: hypothetical protein AAGF47_11170, partial [Planctomycetota bacterium]
MAEHHSVGPAETGRAAPSGDHAGHRAGVLHDPADQVTMITYGPGDPVPAGPMADWLEFVGDPRPRLLFATTDAEARSDSVAALQRDVPGVSVLEIEQRGRAPIEIEAEALVAAARRATTRWLLFFKLDTLPFRIGRDRWLAEVLAQIEAAGCSGFAGSARWPDLTPAGDGWAKTQRFSLNFGLIERERFLRIVERESAQALEKVRVGGVRSAERFFVEAAIERDQRDAGRWNLFLPETPEFSVFHVNVWGEKLERVRERYRRRIGIGPFLNTAKP